MVEAKYPYVPGESGIPLDDLEISFEGDVCGGSGKQLFCLIDSDTIVIFDKAAFKLTLSANVISEILFVGVRSRDKETGERHPDLFAKKFIGWAVAYFENQGHLINRFMGNWTRGEGKYSSTNFDAYQAGRKSGMNPAEAAMSTWTGKTVAELGFTEVVGLKEGIDYVTLHFKRPN